MRNKKLLNTLVLFGICASLFSLASCQGIKGEQGEPGTPGVDGKPGEDGKDGEDGNTWLTGEGTPASSLGKNGDLYLDTATSDYYIKKDGSWVKTGNLKGEDGEDGKPGENGKPGEDGQNGSNGPQGPQGATAWSNTILPSANGYVTVDKGSAVKDETITFTFVPLSTKEKKYELNYLKLNDTVIDVSTITNNKYSTKMVPNGFVVTAVFGEDIPSTTTDVNSKLESANPGDIVTLSATQGSTGESEISTDINVKEGVILRIETGLGSGSSNAKINVASNAKVEVENNVTTAIEASGEGAEVIIKDSSSVKDVVITGNNAKLQALNSTTEVAYSILEEKQNTSYNVTGNISVFGDNVTIDGISTKGLLKVGAKLVTKDDGSRTVEYLEKDKDNKVTDEYVVEDFTLKNSYLYAETANWTTKSKNSEAVNNTNAYYLMNVKGSLTIHNNEFYTSSALTKEIGKVYNLIEQRCAGPDDALSEIVVTENIFDMEFATHNALNFYNIEDNSNILVNNNAFLKLGSDSQVMRLSELNSKVGNETTGSKVITFSNNNINRSAENDTPAFNTPILFQRPKDWASNKTYKLLFNDNDSVDSNNENEVAISNKTLESYTNGVYVKNVFSTYYDSNNEDIVPEVLVNGISVSEANTTTKNNVFINGQLYTNAVFQGDTLVESLSTKVEGVEFADASGDGKTAETALEIANLDHFYALSELRNYLADSFVSSLYFKQTADLYPTKSVSYFSGNYDGNGKKIYCNELPCTISGTSTFRYTYGTVSFKNVTLEIGTKPVTLIWDTAIQPDKAKGKQIFTKGLTIDGLTVNGNKVLVNQNNFGFVTVNPIQNVISETGFTNDGKNALFSFNNININVEQCVQQGTSGSPFVGSGPIGNVELKYTGCTFKGKFYGEYQVGFLWGNGYYFNATDENKQPLNLNTNTDFSATNCKLDGNIYALNKVAVALGVDSASQPTIENYSSTTAVQSNTLSSLTESKVKLYWDGSSIKATGVDDSLNTNSICISVNKINFKTGGYSNNIKFYFDLGKITDSTDLTEISKEKFEIILAEKSELPIGCSFIDEKVSGGRRYTSAYINGKFVLYIEKGENAYSIESGFNISIVDLDKDNHIVKGKKNWYTKASN